MVTLEQFKEACLKKKPLFGIEITLDILKFFPDIFEITAFRSRVKRGRPRELEIAIRSKDFKYFTGKNCFATKEEAEKELAKRLTERLEKLKNGRRCHGAKRNTGISVCRSVLANNGSGDGTALVLRNGARSKTGVRVRRVHPGQAKVRSTKAKKRENR